MYVASAGATNKERLDAQLGISRGKAPTTMWRYGSLLYLANTKSEARAGLKRALGLKRLPAGALVVRAGHASGGRYQ